MIFGKKSYRRSAANERVTRPENFPILCDETAKFLLNRRTSIRSKHAGITQRNIRIYRDAVHNGMDFQEIADREGMSFHWVSALVTDMKRALRYTQKLGTVACLLVLLVATSAEAKEHPFWRAVGKYTGYTWTHDHILEPINGWAEHHNGLISVGSAMANFATNALLGAGR
jgi:hypothetical protein